VTLAAIKIFLYYYKIIVVVGVWECGKPAGFSIFPCLLYSAIAKIISVFQACEFRASPDRKGSKMFSACETTSLLQSVDCPLRAFTITILQWVLMCLLPAVMRQVDDLPGELQDIDTRVYPFHVYPEVPRGFQVAKFHHGQAKLRPAFPLRHKAI